MSARETVGGVQVSVVDNGIGVDPADRALIFQMFHRPANARVAGSGIGLAICERIVARHGGRIWVDAAPGGGSAFRFTLPAAAPRAAGAGRAALSAAEAA